MLVKCLQICAHVFIDRPQNCAQTLFRSCAGLRPNFGHSRSKLCPIMCRSRTKLCPNFGCSRARLCPISFAPCRFPKLAGTRSSAIGNVLSDLVNRCGNPYVNVVILDKDNYKVRYDYKIISKNVATTHQEMMTRLAILPSAPNSCQPVASAFLTTTMNCS